MKLTARVRLGRMTRQATVSADTLFDCVHLIREDPQVGAFMAHVSEYQLLRELKADGPTAHGWLDLYVEEGE